LLHLVGIISLLSMMHGTTNIKLRGMDVAWVDRNEDMYYQS